MPKGKHPSDSDQPELPLAGQAAGPDAASTPPAESPAPADPVSDGASELPAAEAAEPVAPQNNDNAPLAHSYRNWFLDYASYVILDRAVPHLDDGLKPVQRRILHTLYEKDDGRFHKVANIVGATMAFHPHGDASIGAALVGMGQRAWLIEPQGNYGNTLTGDAAAAPRYIECRLTPFAREVLFNPKTTNWQKSYDGRSEEPVTLPAKFPITLLEGAEGIAVGLTTKILPHNFNDLCRASINHLQGKAFRIRPDFPSGGIADFSAYHDGERGAKVKVRAKVEQRSRMQFAITELPYGATTESLKASIESAIAKGKLKVKRIEDMTSESVEILIELSSTADPDKFIDQLYVFTDCEVTLSPAACVIIDDKPSFMGVSEILRRSVDRARALLGQELEIRLAELADQWHADSLERIFIEERIYRRIEGAKTWEAVLHEIREGLVPHVKKLRREVTDEDITRLTEIRIKRISAYNRFKADEAILALEKEMKQVKHDLAHLTDYAIAWFERLQEKYGKGHKRRTTSDEIEQISAASVVVANQKLHVNKAEGFIALNTRKDDFEFVQDVTPLDDVVAFMQDATCKLVRVAEKVFIGKNIEHLHVVPKDGDDRYYTLIYQDKESGKAFAKRFQLGGMTREKVYNLAASEGSKLVFFDETKNPDSMPKAVTVYLSGRCSARVKEFIFDLSELTVGARGNKGVTVTQYPIRDVKRA
ncbi:MAG: DNA gyrase/topoisomerase IV subunit A [Opitutaceae bacterium]|jgi:topoisomerase-4 subunit A|nr:DNA gyrase/topoisomerase IV subunit A [Opitutaceae bacterium]